MAERVFTSRVFLAALQLLANTHLLDCFLQTSELSLVVEVDCILDWQDDAAKSAVVFAWHIENRKSAVRCKVEHPYRIVKNIFGFRKAVYRGLRKNLNRLHVLFASANLYMLARAGGSLCPA